MDRRAFFSSMLGAVALVQDIDFDRLLWVPERKRIFVPEAPAIAAIRNPVDHLLNLFFLGLSARQERDLFLLSEV